MNDGLMTDRLAAELRRTRLDLVRSEQKFEFLYENVPVMYFTLDPTGRVRSVNAYGASALGYSPEELTGRCVTDVFHEDDRETARFHLTRALASPGTTRNWELRKRHCDGHVIWVHETVRCVLDDEGEPLVVVACHDVTDRKRAENALAASESKLAGLSLEPLLAEERERRRIAAELHDSVGHELAVVRMRLDTLDDAHLNGNSALVAELREGVDRCIRMTRTMTFELSSPLLYELGFEPALRGLGEQMLEANGIRFRFKTDHTDKPVPQQIAIMLLRTTRELLVNVMKHADASSVTISSRFRDGRLAIGVADDGCGIDHERNDGSRGDQCGIFGVRERLALIDGTLDIGPCDGGGTLARLEVPLSQ